MTRVYIVFSTQWNEPEVIGVYATIEQAENSLRDLTYNERLYTRIEAHRVKGTWQATQVTP